MTSIMVILRLILLVISWFTDRNSETKKLKEEAVKEVMDGIKEKDNSKIIGGFDRLNNI